ASLREIERYVATGEPLDKAGAYAIQGEGARLVATFDGCLANITGLPLCHAYFALRRVGLVSGACPEGECQRHFEFVSPVARSARRRRGWARRGRRPHRRTGTRWCHRRRSWSHLRASRGSRDGPSRVGWPRTTRPRPRRRER